MSEVGANQTQLILLGCLAGLFLGIFGSWRYNEAYYPFCRSQEEYCEMAKYVSALKNFQTKIDNGLIEDRFIVEARSKPTRNDIIAETVRNISFIRSELVQAKKLKASNNAEELAALSIGGGDEDAPIARRLRGVHHALVLVLVLPFVGGVLVHAQPI